MCWYVRSPLAGNFMEASYDDSGHVEFVNTYATRVRLFYFMTKLLRSSFISLPGENPVHDLRFDFSAFMEDTTPRLYELLTESRSQHDLEELPRSVGNAEVPA